MSNRPLIKRIDIIIILIALTVAAGCLIYNRRSFGQGGDTVCELYVDNKLQSIIDLNKNDEIVVYDRDVVLTVKDNAIAFKSSDCPDKICIRTGFISHPGQTAVCLPNRVSIKIVSRKIDIDAPDMVAQ